MSELLVRVHSKSNPLDLYKDCQLTKRGDVISACVDGWPWGKEELTNPAWRIFKIPVLPLDEALALTVPEFPQDINDQRLTLLKRIFRLDVDNALLPLDLKAYLLDDLRVAPTFTVTLPLSTVRSLKLAKQRVLDPVFPDMLLSEVMAPEEF